MSLFRGQNKAITRKDYIRDYHLLYNINIRLLNRIIVLKQTPILTENGETYEGTSIKYNFKTANPERNDDYFDFINRFYFNIVS